MKGEEEIYGGLMMSIPVMFLHTMWLNPLFL